MAADSAVSVEWWNDGRFDYNIYLHCDEHTKYRFQGKRRSSSSGGKRYESRHDFFPEPEQPWHTFQDKQGLIRFVAETLPRWHCPPELMSKVVGEIQEYVEV